jgi:putative transposase
VGWEVLENEPSEQAAQVLHKAWMTEAIPPNREIIPHADNDTPMKSTTMFATMERLGIAAPFSLAYS